MYLTRIFSDNVVTAKVSPTSETDITRLRQPQVEVQQSWVIGGTHAGDGVPSRDSIEALGATAKVVTRRDVVKQFGLEVQSRVEETDGSFTYLQTLLNDLETMLVQLQLPGSNNTYPVDDRCNDRSRHRSTTPTTLFTFVEI